jgi:dephospho-CoA kinase
VRREVRKREGVLPPALSGGRQGLYVIGLTGNIATGKSTVVQMLAQLGAQVIDADALAHQAMRAGTPVWHKVVEEFGRDILQEDGEIDRARLGAQTFAEPAAMARLEAIVHPVVIAEAERLMLELDKSGSSSASRPVEMQVAVLEAIKLIESGMHHRCDELWVVTCRREQQVQRLMQARRLSQSAAELRIDAQPHQAEKAALASVVIDNSGDLEETQAQVQHEWDRIMQARRCTTTQCRTSQGGRMSVLRTWIDEHPFLSMWAILAVGMVAIFLITARNVDLLPTQRLFMAIACVALAGLCTWIVSWE